MLACSMYTALGQRNALSMLTLSLISSGFVRIHVGTGVGYPQELISSMVRELTGSYVPLGLTNLIYCRSLLRLAYHPHGPEKESVARPCTNHDRGWIGMEFRV